MRVAVVDGAFLGSGGAGRRPVRTPTPCSRVLAGLAISALCVSVSSCGLGDDEQVALRWTDESSGIQFKVTQEVLIADIVTRLYVQRDGTTRRIFLDDRIPLRTVSFLRHRDWLLVLTNQFVLGGYHYGRDRLYRSGRELPFTIHTGRSGDLVTWCTFEEGPVVYVPDRFVRICDQPQGLSSPDAADGAL